MTTAPKPRRGNGEGSIYRVTTPAGERWVGQLDLGVGPNGKRRRKKVTGKTRTAVSTQMRDLRKKIDAGQDVARKSPTVAELAQKWLKLGAPGPKGRKQQTTTYRLERRINDHLLGKDGVGGYRVDQLCPEHIETWLAAEEANGAAHATLLDYRGDLRQLLNFAKRRNIVTRNVAEAAVVPEGRSTSAKMILTEVERERLYDAVEGDRMGPYFVLLGELGLRPGEADALRWSCVDLDDGVLIVEAGIKRKDGMAFAIGPPKTAASNRVLDLTNRSIAALRRQRINQAEERLAIGKYWSTDERWDDLVFRSELGTPLHSSNVRRSLRQACIRAGVPQITPAALRPTAATIMAEDMSLRDVADQLGHVSTRMVDRIYRHRPARVGTAVAAERARAARKLAP